MAVLTLGLGCALAAAVAPGPDAYVGRERVVLVFAARLDDVRLLRQRAEVEALMRRSDDRDLVFEAVSSHQAATLRRRFGVGAGRFAVRLIGKDGGVKLRSDKVLAADRLAATIDAMPMRQQELRTPRQGGSGTGHENSGPSQMRARAPASRRPG